MQCLQLEVTACFMPAAVAYFVWVGFVLKNQKRQKHGTLILDCKDFGPNASRRNTATSPKSD